MYRANGGKEGKRVGLSKGDRTVDDMIWFGLMYNKDRDAMM